MKVQQKTVQISDSNNPSRVGSRSLKIRLLIIAFLTALLVAIIILVSDQLTLLSHRQHQQPITDNLAAEINTFIVHYYAHSVKDLAGLSDVVDICTGKKSVDNPSLLSVLNTCLLYTSDAADE